MSDDKNEPVIVKGIRAVRDARGVRAGAIAAQWMTLPTSVYNLERRPMPTITLHSLSRYVAALGGELQLYAEFPDGSRYLIDMPTPQEKRQQPHE